MPSEGLLKSCASAAAIGFNVETVTYKNIKFQVWDLGGQTSIRPYWRCYYPNTQVCCAMTSAKAMKAVQLNYRAVQTATAN